MRKLWRVLPLLLILGLGPATAQQPIALPPITGPAGSTPLVTSTTGTTGQITATLAGAAGKWTYVCGFVATSAGTTQATLGNIAITGTIATMNFEYAFVSSGQGILGVQFSPACISSSAQNTNIVLTIPAGGAGTVVAGTIWGFLL